LAESRQQTDLAGGCCECEVVVDEGVIHGHGQTELVATAVVYVDIDVNHL
jgi:hypothetical protein